MMTTASAHGVSERTCGVSERTRGVSERTRGVTSHVSVCDAIEILWGWGVSACVPTDIEDKRPVVTGWDAWHQKGGAPARFSPGGESFDLFYRQAGYNYAILLGETCNLVAIDCDTQESYEAALRVFHTNPWIVKSKRGGHFYFRASDEVARYLNNNTRIIIKGVSAEGVAFEFACDFKGQGGYTVGPWSRTSVGHYTPRNWPWTPEQKAALPVFNLDWEYRADPAKRPGASAAWLTFRERAEQNRQDELRALNPNPTPRRRAPYVPRPRRAILQAELDQFQSGIPLPNLEQARLWLDRQPGAVSGSGGHSQTLAVACALLNDFDLSDDEAWGLLAHEYNHRCVPPWSDRELQTFIRKPPVFKNPRGCKLSQNRAQYLGDKYGRAKIITPEEAARRRAVAAEIAKKSEAPLEDVAALAIEAAEAEYERLEREAIEASKPLPEPCAPFDYEAQHAQLAEALRAEAEAKKQRKKFRKTIGPFAFIVRGKRVYDLQRHEVFARLDDRFISNSYEGKEGPSEHDRADNAKRGSRAHKRLKRVFMCGTVAVHKKCAKHGKRGGQRNRCELQHTCPTCGFAHAETTAYMLDKVWPGRPSVSAEIDLDAAATPEEAAEIRAKAEAIPDDYKYAVVRYRKDPEAARIAPSIGELVTMRKMLVADAHLEKSDLDYGWVIDLESALIFGEEGVGKLFQARTLWDDRTEVAYTNKEGLVRLIYQMLREPSDIMAEYLAKEAQAEGAQNEAEVERLLKRIANFPFLANANIHRHGRGRHARGSKMFPFPKKSEVRRQSITLAHRGKPEDWLGGAACDAVDEVEVRDPAKPEAPPVKKARCCNNPLAHTLAKHDTQQILHELPAGTKPQDLARYIQNAARLILFRGGHLSDQDVANCNRPIQPNARPTILPDGRVKIEPAHPLESPIAPP